MSSPNLLYNHAGRFLSKKRHSHKKTINTQTSKTILQLADQDIQQAKNDDLSDESRKLRFDRKSNIIAASNIHEDTPESCENFIQYDCNTENKKKNCYISPKQWSRFCVKEIRIKSFSVQEKDDLGHGDNTETSKSDESSESFTTATTIDSQRRARSLSPPPTHRSSDEINVTIEEEEDTSTKTSDTNNRFNVLMLQVKSSNWNVSLKAMSDIAEILENVDYERLYSSMPELNQRLITFLRSPRSHVCRTACQIAGRFFAIIKDTRRPEFDAIVDLLLLRTADANKFIRNDANLALDTLIIHIPPFHTIRVISQKAPSHKNDLVRITSARLMVCIVGLAGADLFLSPPANEASRKRLIQLMAKFILDKNGKTREYGARLYVTLYKHPHFELHLKKILNKPSISEMKKIMKNVQLA